MSNISNLNSEQKESILEVVNVGIDAGSEMLSSILSKKITMKADRCQISGVSRAVSSKFKPSIAVTVEAMGAFEGKAVVVIKNKDVQAVLDIFMNGNISENQEFVLDEFSLGTIRELINQVLVPYAEALTGFFGSSVSMRILNIRDFEGNNILADEFLCKENSRAAGIGFSFGIDKAMKSNFICIASENLISSMCSKMSMSSKESELSLKKNRASDDLYSSLSIKNGRFPDFGGQTVPAASKLLNGNMDILMDVPLNVTIEIGKTRKKMKEILEFGQGTIIALDKQAGAPVDVVVNGQLIARGDVVVIDDNFGVRISEIIGTSATNKDE